MINLSVCDKIDGLGKIDELRNAGDTFQNNVEVAAQPGPRTRLRTPR